MLAKELQLLFDNLPQENQKLFEGLINYFEQKLKSQELIIQFQASRIKELEDQLSKNSGNSSKPPSTDGFSKPSPKSTRKSSGRKVGGQKGHKGTTLKMVAHPDATKRHEVNWCESCHLDLSTQPADRIDRRQVYDIPRMKMLVTEHQSEVKQCSQGLIGMFNMGLG